MPDSDQTKPSRQEALAIGWLMLEAEEHDLNRALYRVYMHFREHFLREYELMDTTPYATEPDISRRWQQAKANARSLAAYVQQCWVTAIIHAQHTETPPPTQIGSVSAAGRQSGHHPVDRLSSLADMGARDQPGQEALDFAIAQLQTTNGDIPQTLYNLEQHFQKRCQGQNHEWSIAAATAQALTRHVKDTWATVIITKYTELRRPDRTNGKTP